MEANNAEGMDDAPPPPASAAAAAPTSLPAFSDEAIAMLVALTGGDEASARALLEVKERENGVIDGVEEGAPPFAVSTSPLSFSLSLSLTSYPSLPLFLPNRPPPATSSRPRTSFSPVGSPR